MAYIDWCNENEARSYPLAQHASQRDITGKRLPFGIIVDMCIVVPAAYADAYVSSVYVTPDIISIAVASSSAPLLACTVARTSYKAYQAVAMQPQIDDVSGWVVFGSYTTLVRKQYRFTSKDDGGLAHRAIRVIKQLPVTGVAKYGGRDAQSLDQLVTLIGGGSLRTFKDASTGNIVLELDESDCSAFLGPCDEYASAGGCYLPPIRTLNGVPADKNGIITIRFEGEE